MRRSCTLPTKPRGLGTLCLGWALGRQTPRSPLSLRVAPALLRMKCEMLFTTLSILPKTDQLTWPIWVTPWPPFSKSELLESLAGCSGWSAPGPDHITWRYLKSLVVDSSVHEVFLWIANACLLAGYWPQNFKTSKMVIIPKLGKPAYNVLKAFHPIVLLVMEWQIRSLAILSFSLSYL